MTLHRIKLACSSLAFATAWIASVLSLASTVPAVAQQPAAADQGLMEIVVTARKREETLIAVPISVQAFSADELKQSGVTDLKTLRTIGGFSFPASLGTAAAGRAFGVLIFRGLAGDTGQVFENSGSLFIGHTRWL